MMPRTLLNLTVLAAALSGTAALAHHSPVGVFRTDERATVDGVLVSIVYRRPHSYLEVRAPDGRDQMRLWAIECGDVRQVRERVADGALRPGDRVIVTGDPARDDGQWRVRLRRLVRPDDGWEWREADR